MRQYNCVFVILHYITNEDTIKCIESIKRLDRDNSIGVGIVVVDNCSPNKKYAKLKDYFKGKDEDIFWLETPRNLGFANGNNYGYVFAKNKLNAAYIICINNDTEVRQGNFVQEMISLYKETRFDILGPDIISIRDGGHQNPQDTNSEIDFVEVLKKTIKCLLVALKYTLPEKKKDYKFESSNHYINVNNIDANQYFDKGIKLHGAAVIFSPAYLRTFDTAFDPRTYMYCEEDFLLWRAIKNDLKMVYSSKCNIYHKEYSSTQMLYKNKTNKQLRFKHLNMFKSYSKLLKAILFDRRVR